ncbi:hypothetical protein CFIO01_10264 [Colletotrichum fioriniae PJ7]|uniref:Uncharacterized protein n=1 Tax=Colletotrichum fioriniae PJ7 TaxID=1445577 RepID=A0A010S715_9PEZI|nr:hypothetical protein CFIO01_10264 [Colletotrichum fioriniae PJ7]
MQDWIRRSLTAATNKNDNNRTVNHCVIGRPSFGSVSRSPLTGHYSSVQNFKDPPTSHPSAAAHQKRCHFSQWLQKHQDTIPQARAHVSQNKKQQLFVSTQSPRRETAAKHAHPPAHHQKRINYEYAHYLAAKHSRIDSGTRAKVLPTHVSLLSAVTNNDCCSWVCAYCQVLQRPEIDTTDARGSLVAASYLEYADETSDGQLSPAISTNRFLNMAKKRRPPENSNSLPSGRLTILQLGQLELQGVYP